MRSFADPPFEIRIAESGEVVERQHLYADAVLVADLAREIFGVEIVVYSRALARNLYDSRKLRR